MRTARIAIPLLVLAGCGGGDALLGPSTAYARRVVFLSDRTNFQEFRIYLAQYDGETRDLTGPLTQNGDILAYGWSPDERHVAFLADAFADTFAQLFLVNANGGGRVEISTDVVAGGNAFDFAFSPNGNRLAYRAETQFLGATDLISIRPDRTGRVRLTPPFLAGQSVFTYRWSPDSAEVAYVANQDALGVVELFVAPSDGVTASVKVSGTPVPGGGITFDAFPAVVWSPDSSQIAYRADQDTDGLDELYVSSRDGATNVRVSGPVNVGIDQFAWSPNGARLAYLADQDTPGRIDLYTVLPDGTDLQRVSADLVAGGNVQSFAWSPQSDRLAYLADQVVDGQQSLHTVGATGGTATTVSGALLDAGVSAFAWSPNGARLAYLARQGSFLFDELYTVRPDGSQNVKVSKDFTVQGHVDSFQWNPSSQSIAYLADLNVQNVLEAHVTGALGGSHRVSSSSAAPGVLDYEWSPNGSTLVYLRVSQSGSVVLYRATSGDSPVKLSGLVTPPSTVINFRQPGKN